MIKAKRILSLLILSVLIICLSSCYNSNKQSDTTDHNSEFQEENIILWDKGISDYTIVIAEGSSIKISNAVTNLNKEIMETFDKPLMVYTDSSENKPNEIIIGSTNHIDLKNLPILTDNEFAITCVETKVVIYAFNDDIIDKAVNYFIDEYLKPDNEKSITIKKGLFVKLQAELDTGDKELSIKVATYNIANGKYTNYDYEILAQDILESGAEIVALQEVDINTKRNQNKDTIALLSKYTGYNYYKFVPTISPYQGGEYGVAVLSKYPIVSYDSYKLSKTTPDEEQRILLHTVIDINGTQLDFFATHIQQVSINIQLSSINTQTSKCNSFILAGDFNYQEFSIFNIISKSQPVNNSSNKMITTKNSQAFDNIIVSNNIEFSNTKVIDNGHSDHYMLVTDVIVKK